MKTFDGRVIKAVASKFFVDTSDGVKSYLQMESAYREFVYSYALTVPAESRAQLGAVHAFDILPAVWLASACSVGAGILAAKGLSRCWKT